MNYDLYNGLRMCSLLYKLHVAKEGPFFDPPKGCKAPDGSKAHSGPPNQKAQWILLLVVSQAVY